MDERSIGVFDSGLGGLTAVKQIIAELPKENIVYFGDTGRVPYGTRSKETIIKYSKNDVNFLLEKNVKIIVIACGTVSSTALSALKEQYDVPILGVVEATARAAVNATRNGKIGIIGTPGTIKSGAYEKYIKAELPEASTFKMACPLFVPLVETGHFDTEITRLATKEYLEDMKAQGIDTLILGCTHYPLLSKAIGEYLGGGVSLINPGVEVAKELKGELLKRGLLKEDEKNGTCSYFVSDNVDGFESLGGMFLERKISGQVEKIDIEKY